VPTLSVFVNGRELIATAYASVAWLSWDISACRREERYATLSVGGAVEIQPSEYDTLRWLEYYPLEAGSVIELSIKPGMGRTPPVCYFTAADNEALRRQVAAAEASGEMDLLRIGPLPQYRDSCSLQLEAPSMSPVSLKSAEFIDTLISSGMWSAGHRSSEWRLSANTLPRAGVAGACSWSGWVPVESATTVRVGI
jgi:hypothetical protein